MRLANRGRKGWPDLDVGASVRGADGSRPVFSVVATPFGSVGAQVGTRGAVVFTARLAGAEIPSSASGVAQVSTPTRNHTAGCIGTLSSLTVGVPETLPRQFMSAQGERAVEIASIVNSDVDRDPPGAFAAAGCPV